MAWIYWDEQPNPRQVTKGHLDELIGALGERIIAGTRDDTLAAQTWLDDNWVSMVLRGHSPSALPAAINSISAAYAINEGPTLYNASKPTSAANETNVMWLAAQDLGVGWTAFNEIWPSGWNPRRIPSNIVLRLCYQALRRLGAARLFATGAGDNANTAISTVEGVTARRGMGSGDPSQEDWADAKSFWYALDIIDEPPFPDSSTLRMTGIHDTATGSFPNGSYRIAASRSLAWDITIRDHSVMTGARVLTNLFAGPSTLTNPHPSSAPFEGTFAGSPVQEDLNISDPPTPNKFEVGTAGTLGTPLHFVGNWEAFGDSSLADVIEPTADPNAVTTKGMRVYQTIDFPLRWLVAPDFNYPAASV